MRVFVYDHASRAAVLGALCRLPDDVRAFAVEKLVYAGVGIASAGLAIPRSLLAGAEGFVVVAEREPAELLAGTIAHETAHLYVGCTGSALAERVAATVASAWGFNGPSVDAARNEGNFAEAARVTAQRQSDWQTRVTDDTVEITCGCGRALEVHAPVVARAPAMVGLECRIVHQTLDIVEVADLVQCSRCGASADVRWTDTASPRSPAAIWRCECGETAVRRLGPVPATRCEPAADSRPS